MKLPTILLIAVLPPLGDAWRPVKLAGLSTITSPVELKLVVKNGDGKSAPKGLKYWTAPDGRAMLVVSFLPAKMNEKSDKNVLTAFSNAVIKPGGGQITSSKWIKKNGHIGLDFTYKNTIGLAAKHRAYRVGGWILDAGVTWKAGDKIELSRVDKFVTSFTPIAKQ